MKRIAGLGYFLLMASMGLQAHDHDRPGHPDREAPFATSAFDSDDDDDSDNNENDAPYEVDVTEDSFVDLSKNGNVFIKDGNIDINPFGLEIEEAGDYEVYFSAELENEEGDPLELDVALVTILDDFVVYPELMIATEEFVEGERQQISLFGFLKDVDKATLLSLKIKINEDSDNVDQDDDRDVTVFGWTISARKIDGHARHDGEK